MDVHLWAKLDEEGRLESVQSSCTQPVCRGTLRGHDDTNMQRGTSATEQSEKFVPYMEKKALVYKLDAKVDEMALIITQMAELNKRVKVQEKLITQYEEKFTQCEEKLDENKKTISALEKENRELKKITLSSCKVASSNTTLVNCPRTKRPSSWPGTRDSHSHNKQDVIVSFDQGEHGTVNVDNNKDGVAEALPKIKRPSSLSVSSGSYNLSAANTNNEVDFSLRCQGATAHSVYSYVKRLNTNQDQFSLEKVNSKEIEDSTKDRISRMCSIGPRDQDGYLDMNHAHEIFDEVDSFYCFGQEVEENTHVDSRQSDVVCQSCCENEAIHSTWIDVKNGTFLTKQPDTFGVCEKYIHVESTDIHHDYVSIPEEDLSEHFARPPLPNPRTSRLHRSHTDTFDDRCTGSQTVPKHLSKGKHVRDRSLSLPSEPRKDGKQRMIVKSKSFEKHTLEGTSLSCMATKSDRRSLGNDMKKDDDLNTVLRDMRTTMEWNKSKKKLISRSHHNTVDDVEKKLKSTVQDVYGVYTTWYTQHGSRSKKFSKERLLQKIKNIGQYNMDDLQCEDFMSKCLDLVHRTIHFVKSP